jgi:hypothetical protein
MAVEKAPAAPGSFASLAFENPGDIVVVPEGHRQAERDVLAALPARQPPLQAAVSEVLVSSAGTPPPPTSVKKEKTEQTSPEEASRWKRGDRVQTKALGTPVVVLNPRYGVLKGTKEIVVRVVTDTGEKWLCRERGDLKPRKKRR